MDNRWNAQTTYPNASQNQPLHLVLPPGWMSVIDPISGKTYYANPSTGQTSWDPPKLPPPPPPPSQPLQLPPPLSTVNPNVSINLQGLASVQNSSLGANTAATTGNENNITTHISTLQANGIFLPAVRAIIQSSQDTNELNNPNTNSNNNIEFPELSTGIIADMAQVQANYREQQYHQQQQSSALEDENANQENIENEKKKRYYEPLKPMELPIASRVPHIEPGRVDIRIMSLMDALKRIEKQ